MARSSRISFHMLTTDRQLADAFMKMNGHLFRMKPREKNRIPQPCYWDADNERDNFDIEPFVGVHLSTIVGFRVPLYRIHSIARLIADIVVAR